MIAPISVTSVQSYDGKSRRNSPSSCLTTMAADVEDQAHEAYMIHWSEELRAMDAAYNEDEAKAKILLDEQKRKVEAEVGKLRSEIAPMTPLYERLVQLQDEVKAYKLRDMDTTFNESRMARSAAHRKARIAHHDKLRDYIRNVTPRESQVRPPVCFTGENWINSFIASAAKLPPNCTR